jgi:DNA-binding MurR/RpiR family transcriptional regulator
MLLVVEVLRYVLVKYYNFLTLLVRHVHHLSIVKIAEMIFAEWMIVLLVLGQTGLLADYVEIKLITVLEQLSNLVKDVHLCEKFNLARILNVP